MATISIESKPVIFGYENLYLVYMNGNEFVIRGGPGADVPPFGYIVTESGVLIGESEDRRVDDNGNPVTP